MAVVSIWLSLTACANHFVFHPKSDPPGVQTWGETVVRGKLLIRLEWARPAGEGPFAAVIVHPEAGHVAGEMRGVVRDLAKAGYLAVAADYRREKKGIYRQTLFTWRDPDDPRAVIDLVRRRPDVDPERIALVGFSQGGVYSLLIAAYTQQASSPCLRCELLRLCRAWPAHHATMTRPGGPGTRELRGPSRRSARAGAARTGGRSDR